MTPDTPPAAAADPADSARAVARSGPAPGSLYRHYKGHAYRVVGPAVVEATLEPAVVYRADGDDVAWVRPLADWGAPVETPEGARPRFAAVPPPGEAAAAAPPLPKLYAVLREGRREGFTYPTRETAQGVADYLASYGHPSARVVPLVPASAVEALVREAVAAERAKFRAWIDEGIAGADRRDLRCIELGDVKGRYGWDMYAGALGWLRERMRLEDEAARIAGGGADG